MKQTNMTHTVVGLFDNKAEAKAAMDALVKGGFVRENIDLSNRKIANTTNSTVDNDDSVTDSIGDFFSSLFGTDSTDMSIYSDASADTEGILTVMTDSRESAEKAADILDDNGAVDVNERANKYRARTGTATAKNKTTDKDEISIPVVEEKMKSENARLKKAVSAFAAGSSKSRLKKMFGFVKSISLSIVVLLTVPQPKPILQILRKAVWKLPNAPKKPLSANRLA